MMEIDQTKGLKLKAKFYEHLMNDQQTYLYNCY